MPEWELDARQQTTGDAAAPPERASRTAVLGFLSARGGVLLAVACGVALRSCQLGDQIVADDEWHTVLATQGDWTWIASHFGTSDHCIPLTLLYKLFASTVGLTERTLRAPMWLVGNLAPLLALLVPLRQGHATRTALAWLLAISPLAIYFSRYARPYVIVMVLAGVAGFAFFRSWSGGNRRWAQLYVACAIAAAWFHPTAVPFLVAPLAFAAGDLLVNRARCPARSWRRILALAAALGTGWILLLGAPLLEDWPSLAAKAGAGVKVFDPGASALGALRLAAGTGRTWLLAASVGVALLGVGSLARHERRLLAYLGFLSACQIASLFVLRPQAIEWPIVSTRYAMVCLPIGLLFGAAGLAVLDRFAAGALRWWRAGMAPAVACALLLGFGPLPETYRYPNNWTNHALYQYEYSWESVFSVAGATRPERIPRFYEELGRSPAGSLLIVEAPFVHRWDENPFPFYQEIHRQRMRVGFVTPPNRHWVAEVKLLQGEGFRWEHFVHVSDLERLARDGVAYVVFHQDLWAENLRPSRVPPPSMAPWLEWYAARFGPPSHEDDWIVVFDVRRPKL